MKYGRAIRLARAARGLNQKRLAQLAKVSPSYLSAIESGEKRPSLNMLDQLADALGIGTPLLMFLAAESEDLVGIDEELARIVSGAILETVTDDSEMAG